MERLVYENKFASEEDIENFVLEGQANIEFTDEGMKMSNALDPSLGQQANYVLWCEQDFHSDIRIDWEFKPLSDEGLCMLFFAAQGRKGNDIFDNVLSPRTGIYSQYHSGDINTFHISYYRRKEEDERAFHTCNLRKSYGFHLVSIAGDPIPDYYPEMDFFRMSVLKQKEHVRFFINEMEVLHYIDDGETAGPLLGGGKIGFRALAPTIALYRNLKVYDIL